MKIKITAITIVDCDVLDIKEYIDNLNDNFGELAFEVLEYQLSQEGCGACVAEIVEE